MLGKDNMDHGIKEQDIVLYGGCHYTVRSVHSGPNGSGWLTVKKNLGVNETLQSHHRNPWPFCLVRASQVLKVS